MSVKNHEFTFIATLPNTASKEFLSSLHEADCDDATIAVMKGVLAINFDRESESFLKAVVSALADLAKTNLHIMRFEPDFLVSQSEIAERAKLSRQSISNYVNEHRRDGFPAPVARITSDSPLWDWVDVSRWLHDKEQVSSKTVLDARIGRSVNMILGQCGPAVDLRLEKAIRPKAA